MRLPVRASLVLFTGLAAAAGGLRPLAAHAQELAFADRGPRFLQVRNTNQPPVEIDASSSGAMRLLVSVDLEEPTVGRVLKAIERQTGLRFVYSRDVVLTERPVSLRASSITVAAALTEVLLDANVDVLLSSGPQIALVPRREAAARDSGDVRGRVTDSKTGAGIAGALVAIGDPEKSATTGADGNYHIADLPPGTHTVSARYIGYRPQTGMVTVTSGGVVTMDIALEKSTQKLDEVVVTGTFVPTEVKAIPTPVTIVTADDIAQQRPRSVQELFRQVVPSGVSWDVAGSPDQTILSARGAGSLSPGVSKVKVFLDGLELSSMNNAGVDPNSIERIEVIRGPQAAALYGSAAIGGVVQITTKRGAPSLARPELNAQASVGLVQTPYEGFKSVPRQTYAASLLGGNREVNYQVGGQYSHTSDYLPAGEISAQSNPSVFGGMRFARGILSLDLSGRYFVQKFSSVLNPEFMSTGLAFLTQPNFQPITTTNQTYALQLGVQPISWWRHAVTVGIDILSTDQVQTQPRLTTPSDTFLTVINTNFTKRSLRYSTTAEWRRPDVSGSVTAGIDYWRQPLNQYFTFSATSTEGSISNATVTRTRTDNTGYFAQAQMGWRNTLFLTAGVRAEDNTDFGDDLGTPISPRVGVSFVQPVGQSSLKLRGSWGRAISPPPSGAKLAIPLAPTQERLANPNLGPERQRGWDAGFDLFFGDRFSIGATYFDQIAEDLIQLVQVSASPIVQLQYQNVGRVKNSGVEIEGSASFGMVELKGQYGYTRAEVQDLGPGYTGTLQVGDQAFATPKHTAGASVFVTPQAGTALSLGVVYLSSFRQTDNVAQFRCFGGTGPCRPTARDYLVDYPGFTKIKASIRQQLTPMLQAFLAVDNITNNTEFEFTDLSPVMGRVTTIGMQYRY